MLSRRNVRIKVMQLLYMDSRNDALQFSDLLRLYQKSIHTSYELYLFNLYLLMQIAGYAKKDAKKRRAKLLPSDEDKSFTAILAENKLMSSLLSNAALKSKFDDLRLAIKVDADNVRSIYADFSKQDAYRHYLQHTSLTLSDHEKMLLALYKHCIASDLFNDIVEDHYPFWPDDKSLVIGTMKKAIRALPASPNFVNTYLPSDETVEFGEELIRITFYDKKELLEIIEPVLNNWDVDRVAVIDMLLLKMALVELMYFPTIPTKVTLNEFVEISKLYSTDKSKDFINGILDRLMKQLSKQGKINKEGRGLKD